MMIPNQAAARAFTRESSVGSDRRIFRLVTTTYWNNGMLVTRFQLYDLLYKATVLDIYFYKCPAEVSGMLCVGCTAAFYLPRMVILHENWSL